MWTEASCTVVLLRWIDPGERASALFPPQQYLHGNMGMRFKSSYRSRYTHFPFIACSYRTLCCVWARFLYVTNNVCELWALSDTSSRYWSRNDFDQVYSRGVKVGKAGAMSGEKKENWKSLISLLCLFIAGTANGVMFMCWRFLYKYKKVKQGV